MNHPIRGTRRERSILHMHALLELSGRSKSDLVRMLDIVRNAPDTATAIYDVVRFLDVSDTALQEKWGKHITQAWFELHPRVPAMLNVPVMSQDIMLADALMEIHGVLQEISERPARVAEAMVDGILHAKEERRIASALTIFNGDYMQVRRVCDILEELRLIRIVKDEVRVVKSRYARYQALPLASQLYLAWHIDMYHLNWEEYAYSMHAHLAVFQQYLPMMWEMLEHTAEGQTHAVEEFSQHIVRALRPLWQQEFALGMYEQSALHAMVGEYLVDKVFTRYGLIECRVVGSERMLKTLTWTRAGMALLHSERTLKMPCAIDVLE